MHQRLNPEITPQRIQELYDYDKDNGIITQRAIHKKVQRKILPHPDDGSVVVYDPIVGIRQKMLYRSLAYVLGTGANIPKGKKVLCHDLNDNNIAFRNLKLVDKQVYRDVQIAIRNLEGELKIIQHPKDKHAYLLVWNEHRRQRTQVHYDIGAAEEAYRSKALELVKFVNRHIVSN